MQAQTRSTSQQTFTMVDFSNIAALRPTLAALAYYERVAGPMHDELLLEAVDLICPPLLDEVAMHALRSEIDPAVRRGKGRPRKDEFRPPQLVELLKTLNRPDVPSEILDRLTLRLESGTRFSEHDKEGPQYWQRRADDRTDIICMLYRNIYELLGAGPPFVHEMFGELDLGELDPSLSRHEQALVATANVARDRLALDPPSPRTISNIVSASEIGKNRVRDPLVR